MMGSIIYIEDEPDDIFFMERAFKKVAPEIVLKVITNGQEASDFFADSIEGSVSLVLLDLNLPGRSGFAVLVQIRENLRIQNVPVVIFSASSQETDVAEGYRCGCSAYLVKPGAPAELEELVRLICGFWIHKNVFPKASETL